MSLAVLTLIYLTRIGSFREFKYRLFKSWYNFTNTKNILVYLYSNIVRSNVTIVEMVVTGRFKAAYQIYLIKVLS